MDAYVFNKLFSSCENALQKTLVLFWIIQIRDITIRTAKLKDSYVFGRLRFLAAVQFGSSLLR